MDGRRWSDLPADLLREVSNRLWAAADFISFHAVCKPWRNSRDPPFRRTTQFLPWLIAPAEKESTQLKFRCVFSKASYRATPALPVPPYRNWVCSVDGIAFWYLTVENLRPSLHDPLTGEVIHLPLFPHHIGQWEKENPCGIVYVDGTTLVYRIFRVVDGVKMVRFKAALLNPGGTEWIIIERNFHVVNFDDNELCAAYHGGKIMVTTEASLWHVITPDGHNVVAGDVRVPKPLCTTTKPWWQYLRHYNYLLESRGELLWATVQVERNRHYHDQRWRDKDNHKLTLLVLALEEEDSAPKKTMRWVRKDGHSLADRVLFLGYPNSFVVDASRIGGEDGACAFFAYTGREDLPREQVGVYRFDLVSNKGEFVERVPREWNKGMCTWVIPQPAIAPIQELIERGLTTREPKQEHTTPIPSPTHITHIERYYGPTFRALVRNLSLTVTSSQLQHFLSKHGKVSSAEVLYYRKTKRSQGIGHFTMSTMHTHVKDALEALNDLFLHGYRLDVSLVKEERRRLRLSSTEAGEQHI